VSWRLGNSNILRSRTRENLNDSTVIKRACKTLKRISKHQLKSLGLYELKQHKPRFDVCLPFSDQRKQTKMQWSKPTQCR
jgi:hypothetical protein